MNYRVRLLIATVGTLLLTIIITGCDEKANILDNTTPPKAFKAENVKIGSTVKMWSEGMLLSYPGQTEGIRLKITAIDSGKD